MPKNIRKAKELKGLSIYQDRKHGTVFYDFITRNGYILSDEDTKIYTLSIAILPVSIIIFYFSMQFNISTLYSALIAIAFYIVAQLIYRFAFLYRLPCVENYSKKDSISFINNITNNYSKQRLIVLIVFLIAIIITMALYILTSNFTTPIQICLWILVLATFIFLIIVIIALKNK